MKRTIFLIAIVLVLAGAAIYVNNDKQSEALSASAEMKPKPGYSAPTLMLPDLNDKDVAIGGKRDKPTIINFWASWCGPCETEAPDLQALSQKYGDRLDLYGINATSYDRERQAREFVIQQNLTFPILMDRDGKATELYKVSSFPTSLLIDSKGIVRERIPGIISKDQWEEIIDKWLQAEEQAGGSVG
ncbi:TlpA family protein disulfide reductase [Paenibacillus sp. sptzw28]|uniref:TlpA family protein disulfide reductase n=1 Tax=Paenibacillus sp. sptzw28 TaxID=715179 RepID=UPI001C6EE0C9|nr:TlpA disulfide reductase family protein [Paenibacillus sp. sptzw28]QYR23444.1 TlpA family protein disulfide reductase [Paenibacillus sp. sptzw28]